jgi:hypothetical protein
MRRLAIIRAELVALTAALDNASERALHQDAGQQLRDSATSLMQAAMDVQDAEGGIRRSMMVDSRRHSAAT